MDWKELYRQRLTTAEEAVRHIPNGSRVVLGHAVGEPYRLVDAMVANYRQYRNVEVAHWLNFGDCAYTRPEMEGHIRLNAMFAGSRAREAVEANLADYTPAFFGMTPGWFTSGTLPVDVAMICVSKPDKHGYVSTGVSVCATKPAAAAAKIVIAQVNDQMPRTHGDSFLHVSQLTHIVEHSVPLKELPPAAIGDVEQKIGKHCAGLVEDGSTLQLGAGSLPDAVLANLIGKKDLGIHSEMFSDGVVKLVEKGVITGARKTLNTGKLTAGFLMGTRKLYDFVDDNPVVQMLPISYVNDPCVIMQNYKMVSINSCLQVDFTGQVNSESIGASQYSGIGGQLD
ncbi:MAG: 4-hydroxybutyrate CoA-transferase, partial [Clostridiales bacterium]|nr:4-hydroxybutyrate CoA-transferase [Clostridiales bacterium]